jgi:hypothetical protein
VGTFVALQHCTQEDRKIIGDCLRATVEGPFFPEWEFQILFGLTRAEVARVLQAWPQVDESNDIVRRAVHGALGQLIGYPHGEEQAWDRYIAVTPARVGETLQRWKMPKGS